MNYRMQILILGILTLGAAVTSAFLPAQYYYYHHSVLIILMAGFGARIEVKHPLENDKFNISLAFVFAAATMFGILSAIPALIVSNLCRPQATENMKRTSVKIISGTIAVLVAIFMFRIAQAQSFAGIKDLAPFVMMVAVYFLVEGTIRAALESVINADQKIDLNIRLAREAVGLVACAVVSILLIGIYHRTGDVGLMVALPIFGVAAVKDRWEQRWQKRQEVRNNTDDMLSMFGNVCCAMNEMSDVKQLLHYILTLSTNTIGTAQAYVFLFDAKNQHLKAHVISEILSDGDENDDEPEVHRDSAAGEIVYRVFESGTPETCDILPEGTTLVEGGANTGSLACAQMKILNKPVGVIALGNKLSEGGFSPADLKAISALGDHAALAVDKAQLWEMAVTDALTGLYERRFFLAKMREELKRSNRYNTPFSVMMIDIDHFKKVNDLFGHPVGDIVLEFIGTTLLENCRGADVAARFGGEEFVLLLPETQKEEAESLARRLKDNIESRFFEDLFNVTVSVGIASFPVDGFDVKTLMGNTDAALYHAKKTGRNKIVTYTSRVSLDCIREYRMMDFNELQDISEDLKDLSKNRGDTASRREEQ